MVWFLTFEESVVTDFAGNGSYYFTAPGTYTVGRKDCSITVQTDKTISRVHAEISVEPAVVECLAEASHDLGPRSNIHLKDLSKFGTFINKEVSSKPVNSSPESMVQLKNEDVITFGTNKTTCRLLYHPLVFCLSKSDGQSNKEVVSKVESAMGAYVFEEWNNCCTHLLVEEDSPLTELVIKAVISKKSVVSLGWLQALIALDSPSSELPCLSRYVPTLKIDAGGLTLATSIVQPKAREGVLKGWIIVMGNESLYHCQDLPTLSKIAGAAVEVFSHKSIEEVCKSVPHQGLLLIPRGFSSRKEWLGNKALPFVHHLRAVGEEDLLRSILAGELTVSSSNTSISPAASIDTDETVDEVDEQAEDDSGDSIHQELVQIVGVTALPSQQPFLDPIRNGIVAEQKSGSAALVLPEPQLFVESSKHQEKRTSICSVLEPSVRHISPDTNPGAINAECEDRSTGQQPQFRKPGKCQGKRMEEIGKGENENVPLCKASGLRGSRHETGGKVKVEAASIVSEEIETDIIYSNVLVVVKNWNVSDTTFQNFKRFKRGAALSGNSFSSLVPFAKEPYRESDYGREMEEYMKQEKKRKYDERISEELFNAEQLKRRRVTAAEAAKVAGGSAARYG